MTGALDFNDEWASTLRDHDEAVEQISYWANRDLDDDAVRDQTQS